jgi:hypothetical protein
MTILRIGLVLALAVAAAIVANVALLGIASGAHEPVGKLRLSTVVASTPSQPAPAPTATTTPSPTPTAPAPHDHGAGESEDD